MTKSLQFFTPKTSNSAGAIFIDIGISAGFPSPAEDHIEKNISLDELLIKHPAATFFIRAKGDSMINAGIHSDDILIVDRSSHPESGHVVVAAINGELLVKRLSIEKEHTTLIADNKEYKPIHIKKEDDLHIWGVVTNVIHSLNKKTC